MNNFELDRKLTYKDICQVSSIEALLSECGASNIIDKGNYFSFSSPFRDDRRPSAVVYKESLVCVDFGGSFRGSFSFFFKKCTGASLSKYLNLSFEEILNNTYFTSTPVKKQRDADVDDDFEFRIKEGHIRYDFTSNLDAQSYIRRRFLSKDFIDEFQIGYCTELKACRALRSAFDHDDIKFTQFRNRVCIPISEDYEQISLEGRDFTGQAKPKVLYPRGAGSVSGLFNHSNLKRQEPLIVVEGILDMPRIWKYITHNVTTTFGINMTSKQKEQLSEFDKVILFSDSDDAGRQMISELDSSLDKPFWVARLDSGDPGDSSNSVDDLIKAVEQAKESTQFFLDESELFSTTDIDKGYFSI